MRRGQEISSRQEETSRSVTTRQVTQQVQGMIVQEGFLTQSIDGTPPVFEKVFSNARFAQGGNAIFEGRVIGQPRPVVSWTRKGAPLFESAKYRLRYEEQTGNVSLQINNIGPGDEGEYTCTARNQLGEAICSVYIQPEGVAVPAHQLGMKRETTQVKQTQQMTQSEFQQRQQTMQRTQQFQTHQTQQIQQSMQYTNGYTSIEEDFKVDTFEYRILREVSFRESLTRRYAGESDAVLETRIDPSLGPPAPPQVQAKPRNSKQTEGADVIFAAKVPANPRPRLTWFKNGKRVVSSQKHQISYSNQQATLQVNQVTSQDGGHYTLLAENPQGCVVTSAYLAVEPSRTQEQHYEKETIRTEESMEGKMIAPNFVRACADRDVTEGKMTRFDCRVTGRPYPDVTWYINGRQVTDDNTHKILVNESGNHALMITNVSRLDSGVVTCIARNKAGETAFECKLNVIEKELVVAPQFVQRFSGASLKEGDSFMLTARAVGTPVPTITWQKDGVPVQPGLGLRVTVDGGSSSLEVIDAKATDSGWYQCTAQNMAGSTATRARIHVQKIIKQDTSQPHRLHLPTPTTVIQPEPEPEPEIIYLRHVERAAPKPQRQEEERRYPPPQFIIPLCDAQQVEGGRVHLEARVEPVGDPTMNVDWYHNGRPLPASSRLTTTFRFGFIALDLLSVVPEDAGEYTCFVQSSTGHCQSTSKLTINSRASIEAKSQYPESLEYIKQLEDYSKYQRSESIEETMTSARPVFIRPLRDLGQTQEGRNAHFEGQITPVSDPTMRVDWFKDGKPITASSRITTIFNFGYVSLNILHLRAEDSGIYTVRAVNRWGEAVSQSSLVVIARSSVTSELGIPEQQRYIESVEALEGYLHSSHRTAPEPPESTAPPVFQTPIKDQAVREGGFAHFEARLEPVGDSTLRVEWLKDGRPVEASSRITTFFNFGYVALTIKSVAAHDAGRYTCRAYNQLGEASTSAGLNVTSLKDSVIFDSQHQSSLQKIQSLEDSSRYMKSMKEETTVTQKPRFLGPLKGTNKIVEGQRAHFEARVEPLSDTTMRIDWYFNGKLLQSANRIQTYHDFGYVALDIMSVRAEDAGTYTVVARNALGEAQLSATMQIETRSSIDTRSMHHGAYDKTKQIESRTHIEPQYNIEEISKSRPIFVQPLSDPQPVTEGKNIHLECRLEPMGDPTMRVEWFFNGRPITVGSRFRTYYDFGYVALDIIHVTSNDSGEYTVRATNHLGSAHTSAGVRVLSRSDILTETQNESSLEQIELLESRGRRTEREEAVIAAPPVFTRPLHNIETVEGTNVHLECRLQPVGDSSMRVEWLVNGKPVRVGHRFRPAYDFDYVALDLLSVYPEDSGVYTCIARNQLGETVTSSSVRVIAKKDLLLESQHPGGLEKIQYLEDSSRYKRSDVVDEVVTIRPRFITKPKSIEKLREGGHAHFECKLEPVTDSNLKVEWFKNGRPIIVGHRFRPIHDFGYVALDIIDTIEEDSGIYTCRATNLLGTDETSCSLKCLSSSQIVTTTQNEAGLEQIQYLEDRSKYQRKEEIEESTRQAPVFTTSLKQCDIREGQRAHFECRLIPVSDNTMKVDWYHNGQPVKSGSRFTETNNFGFVALDILHCLPEDSGTYTCRARNINGEAVTSSTLNVQSRKSIYLESQHESALSRLNQFESREYSRPTGPDEAPSQPPVFTQPCRDQRLAEGASAHFEARLIPVGDSRLKVEWLRNGVPIQASNRVTTMHDFGYVALNMKHVYPEDSGTYTCRAVNDLGQAVTSATLLVQSKASLLTESQHEAALQKLQQLEDSAKYKRTEEEEVVVTEKPHFSVQLNGPTNVVEGQSVHYECRVEPYPDANLKVEWFHNGQPLQTGHRYRTAYDFGFASLDILTVYEEDKGEYTCRATNRLGQAVSSVNLRVQTRASIIRDTQHKEALQKIQYLEDDSRYKRTTQEEVSVIEKPEFGRPLKNIEHLPEGKMAHLEATLTPVNDATMKVEWFRNGRPIPQGHRFKTTYDFGFVALDILYAYAEDSGTYMCKARNAVGEAVTTCSVSVDSKAGLQLDTLDEQRLKKIKQLEHFERPQVEETEPIPQKPVFITPLNSLENLKEGDHAHLECRVEPISDANLRIEWFVNGKAIKTGHRFRTTHDFGYVALDILYVYAEDSGTYMCKATNLMGEAVNTSTIRVQSRHNILLETQHPEGLEKIQQLEAQGHPTRLEIEEPTPSPPRFVTQLRGTTEIVEGGTAHFEAQIEPLHDPNLRVEVYHNGKPLGSASRFHITFDFGYFALDVGHCLASDAGEYTVKAINKLGSCVSSTSLKVSERGSIILDSQRPEGLEKIKQLEAEPPKRPEIPEAVTRQRPVFTQPLQNIDFIAEGQTAHFECRLIPVGDPTLKVEWFRNEKLLEDSSRITKTHDFGYVSMDMTHVRAEDEGVYMCRASNALGEAVTTASMRIKTKASIQSETQHPEGMRKIRQLEEGREPSRPELAEPIFEKPIFTQVLTGPSELWEGQRAHFEARVVPVGDPTMRYLWYVNGVELKMGSRFHVTHDFGFVTLDIMATVPEDSGLYMCKAINSAGEAVSSTTLKVKPRSAISGEPLQPDAWQKIQDKEAALGARPERPEEPTVAMAPIFTKHLTNADALVEGAHVFIEAQVEPRADPNLKIEWFKNGKSLTTGARIRTTFDFGLVTLSVNSVRPDDSGIYTCKAINLLGEAVSTCTIKVEDRHWLLANSLRPEALPLIDALEGPKEGRPELPEPTFEGPVFISHLNNVVCTEGENAHFECRVEPAKDPTLNIEFFVGGRPIPTGSRFKGNHEFGFVTLDINSCYAEDSGIYTVKATNSKGQASTSGSLKCTSKSDIYLETQHPTGVAGLEKVKEVEEAFASKLQRQLSGPEKEWPKPVWTIPLQPEFKLGEAQALHLEATVEPKDDPHLRIEWFFNGKALAHGSRFKMTSEFGFVTLDLTEVYERDQGIYTCKAWNRSGEAFTSTTIYCTGKEGLIEKTQHPKGQEGLGKIQELEESLRREEQKVTTPDEGQPPAFTSQFQDIRNLSEGEIAHFEASLVPIGDQSMVVEWFYNGKTLEASHRIRTVHAFGMVVLEILGTKIEDSGKYTCRATNKWGSDEISVNLECIDVTKGQRPQFTTQIKSIEGLKDGDSAHFECTLIPVGDPTMKVEWFHNGHPIRHSTRIKQVSDFGFVVMDIAYTQSHDTGEYVCRAKNKYGEDFTRAHITCVGKGGVYLESLQPDSLARIRELESSAAPGAQTPTTPVTEPPRFITQITDLTTLKEGQSAHFEARLVPVNDPNLVVEWYFNGKKLPHGHRYRTFHDFGIVILDILYCYAENSGEYEARATNLVGSDSTKAILKCASKASLILTSQLPQGMEGGLEKIQDLEDAMIRTRDEKILEERRQAPVFTVPLSNLDSLREGESAHFEARLTPTDDPRLKVEWFWNNKPLRTGSRFRTFHDFGFVILEISPVYPEDSGEYSCRASNEWGQAVTSSIMKVEGKRSIIIESQLPRGMEGTIDKIAELEGLGARQPGPVPEDDVGKPPEFITQPSDQVLVEYSLAHFECRLIPINDPSLRVEWFHNGKPLTAGSRFKTINDFGFVILEIAQVDTRDSGLYTCKATNKHGEAVVSCKLQVKGRQGIIMEPQLPNTFSTGTESIQRLEEDLHKKEELLEQEEKPNPPRFISELQDCESIEGGKAHFDCRVEPVGDSTMRIDWFFNGRPFATGSRVHMINDFGYIVLDMEYVYARDTGEYICRATNKWGTATTKAKLTCKAKQDVILDSQLPTGMTGEKLKELEKGQVTEPAPETPTPREPPKFITHISSATVGENEPVRFECRVEPRNDESMRIEWYRNGKLLPSGHRYRTLFDMGFVSLDILYVYPEDSGEYVCRAVNNYGEDFTKATVSCKKIPSIILQNQVPKGMKKSEQLMQMEATIKKYTSEVHLTEEDLYEPEKKQPPRFVTQIQDQTNLVEMEATKFECQLAPVGDPNMKVEWFYNGKPLHHKNRFTPIYDFGYVAMNFGWVYPEDSGEYLCRATNLYGQDETRAIIKTTGKPGIIYDSQLPKGMKSIEKIREMEASWQQAPEEKEDEVKEKEAPVFVTKPEPITVNEGECARFCCRVTGYPRPRVVWLINNTTVVNGTRYRLTYDGMWHLDIPKTRQYDNGKIEIVARNAAGETRVETVLTVKPRGDDYRGVLKNSPRRIMGTQEYRKPEWVTQMEDMQAKLKAQQVMPTFINEITDVYANEEETVTFECQYAGNPLPLIIWYHDDKVLRVSDNVKMTIKDNKSSVTIRRVSVNDAGVYICKAQSDIGIAVTKAKLSIIGGPVVEEKSAEETEEKVETEVVVEKKDKKKKKKKPIIKKEETPRDDSVDVSEVTPLESVSTFSETTETATAERRVDVQQSVEVTAVASLKKVPDDKQFPTDVPDVAGIVAPIQESVTVSQTTSAETTGELITETTHEEFATTTKKTTMKTAKVSQTTTRVEEKEEKLEFVTTQEMLPFQAPLQELAQVDVLMRKGVTIQEVVTLYQAHQFPALRTAPAQCALVSLVERQGFSSLITEMVTHESVEETLTDVFKAFLAMVERKAVAVSEVIPLLKPTDFQIAPWEATSTLPVITEESATETITQTSQVEVKEMKSAFSKKTEVEEEEITTEIRKGLKEKKQTRRKEEIITEVKKKKEIKQQETETEEGASLKITKMVEEFEEGKEVQQEEGGVVFSICSYTAETDEALNLVEGERVYIIENTNSDWWFVKKHLTEEKGWVPAIYLRDEPSYTLYVQKKLHEKIDKLPIFEKPRPGSEVHAPKFVEKLQPKHVPDGATVQFECKVEGNPRPQITWFRQTAIIKPSHDFQIFYDDDNVATLIISEVFPEDAGTFTCVAKNAAGFASSTTELVVESPLSDHGSETGGHSRRSLSRESSLADILEGIPPTFSKKPKACIAPVGSNVDLEVRLVAVPEPDIMWYLKGSLVTPSTTKTIVTTSDMHMYTSVLSLKNVSLAEEGVYTIIARNREGEASMEIPLKLKPKGAEGPFIVEPLKDISATEGEGVVLSSTVTGSPAPKVTWTRDGVPLKGVDVSGDTYTLTLRDIKPSDAGKYVLKATNKHGTVETSANINVLGSLNCSSTSSFSSETQDSSDENTSMSCTLGEQSVTSEVNTVAGVVNEEEDLAGFSSSVAQIREETKLVEKMVTEIKNVKETIQCFHEPEDNVNEVVKVVGKITDKIDKLENIIENLVKRLSIASSGYQSKETETTELATTEIETQTHSSDITLLPSSSSSLSDAFRRKQELQHMKLRVEERMKRYENNSTNQDIIHSEIPFEMPLSDELKRAQAPLFVERFEEQKVQEKGTIRLTAKVIGNPIPSITWFRNNKTLLASPRITEMFDGEQILLEIENADSEQDSGDYKCVATNSVGSATHGARVTIDVARVTFTKLLPDKTVAEESQPFTLECETSHTVSTTWYHNGTELSGMDHRELIQEGRQQKLLFKRVLSKDKGTYTCSVKDQLTSTNLSVKEVKPDFIKKLEDFEVKEQDCAILEVEVTSETANVTWEKDGMPLQPKDGKIEIEKKGPVHKLFIRSTSVHDEGEYSARIGDKECSADVTVIELPPEILTPLSDTTIARGEKALFEVELTKGDALVRWFKDDVEIQFSEHIQLSIDGKRQRLKIYQAAEQDAGVYSCKVGDQVSKARLSVQEPKVEFITRLPDVTMLPVGSDAEFVVELSRSDLDVKWLKKGKEIKTSDHFIISSDGPKHKLVIKKVTLEDQSDYSCIVMNIKTTTKLKIEVIETAPKIQTVKKEYKVQKGEDVEINIKFTGTPKPTAEWSVNGTVIKPSPRFVPKVEEESASLTIKKVIETDVGSYTVKLKNSVGEASAELMLIIIEVPGAPGVPELVEVTDTSVTVHWSEPSSDGNSPILSYILEHHDKEEFLKWTEIKDIKTTTHKVTELITGHEVNFKVSAVNAVGRGKTSDSSRYVKVEKPKAGSPPAVRQGLTDTSAGLGTSVTLECVFSGVPQPEVKWYKEDKILKSKNITYVDNVAKLTITKCIESSGGVYSCKASNSSGTAETSCKLTIQEIPTLHIDNEQLSCQIGIASQWKPVVDFTGYPKPQISWLKDGKEISEDKRVKTYIDENTTTLAIYTTERIDSGTYTVTAVNTAGSVKLDLSLRVTDKPGKPESLEIKDVDAESLTVTWQPPKDDGGVDISKYSLEKCETSKMIWTKVADIERDARTYTVQRLTTNSQYKFRLFAQNPVGISEPAESDPVTVKSKDGVPSAPEGPLEVSGMTDNSCVLSWNVPLSDGGTPILDYIIEQRELDGSWVKIGSTKEMQISAGNLNKGVTYEFRVLARNRVGTGPPLRSEPVVAGTKKTAPSPPESVQVSNIASKSVTLTWEPPLSNGGSELTDYIIEKQPVMSNKWTKVVTLDPNVTKYTVENLKESEFYFRVFAENAIGISFPTTTSLVSLKTHATVPSPPTAPLEVRSTGATSVYLAWGVPESDGGAPLEGYKVAVRDIKKTMWMEVGRVSADVQRLTVKDLQENHEYLIRIFARNEVGFSNPLESDEPFKVQRPTADTEDTDLEDFGIDKETPSLSFTTTTTASWMREAGMDADIHTYSRGSLLRRSEYFFRIWYYAKHLFK